jgi:hypothetical protein
MEFFIQWSFRVLVNARSVTTRGRKLISVKARIA